MVFYVFILVEVSLLIVIVRWFIKYFNVISENDFIIWLGNLVIILNELINRNSICLLIVFIVYLKVKDRVGGLNLGLVSFLME